MGKMVEGKVVVVTGAGSGIGRDLAKAFAANGAKVIVNDTGRAADGEGFAAEQVVGEIRAAAGEAAPVVESVAGSESAQRIVQTALDHFGRIDCVVNNAGITRDRFLFNMSEEEWRAVVDVHLNGSFYANGACGRALSQIQSSAGSYIHMTSTSGLVGNLGQANYAAAKMGIVGLSKSLALDMARFKVRSNCISPWAWTAMTANIPADTPENIARIEKPQENGKRENRTAGRVSRQRSSLDDVSGQIFGVRANEIYLFSQPRILRTLHRSDGWTPETIAEHAIPALAPSFYENLPSMAITPWDPI